MSSERALPKNVTGMLDRHGRTRYRFRKRGYPTRYIKGIPGTPEFDAAVADCLTGILPPKGADLFAYPTGSVVYFLAAGETAVKIGTTINLRSRLSGLRTSTIQELRIVAFVAGGPVLERAFHRLFATTRLRGEWFARSPLLDKLIDELSNLPIGESITAA